MKTLQPLVRMAQKDRVCLRVEIIISIVDLPVVRQVTHHWAHRQYCVTLNRGNTMRLSCAVDFAVWGMLV